MVCNFRKTRKRGGIGEIANTVLECVGPFKTKQKCLEEFLKQNNFTKYEIRGDGNCFYRTIVKFLQLSQNPRLSDNEHLEIRKKVVNEMIKNYEDIEPYISEKENNNIELINNNNFKKKASDCNKIKEIKKLLRDGIWSSDTADIVIQYAAKALNMTLKIYDFKDATKEKRAYNKKINGVQTYRTVPAEPAKFVCYTLPPNIDQGITINMLRVSNSHFELLYPNPPSAATTATSNEINSLLAQELTEKNMINIINSMRPKGNTISKNMRTLTLSANNNIKGIQQKKFGSLKPGANTVSAKAARKRPIIATENNKALARRLQAEENQALKQLENNEALARRLQEEENKASKPQPKKNTRRKPRVSK